MQGETAGAGAGAVVVAGAGAVAVAVAVAAVAVVVAAVAAAAAVVVVVVVVVAVVVAGGERDTHRFVGPVGLGQPVGVGLPGFGECVAGGRAAVGKNHMASEQPGFGQCHQID